jgi:DNA-binding XRE family transcriptional regulator
MSSKQLKQMRIELGAKQQELAKAADISRMTLISMEHGQDVSEGSRTAVLAGLKKIAADRIATATQILSV